MIGRLLDGRYKITREIGRGGMGAVFEAQHAGTGRRVAVKVITNKLAHSESLLARFQREARAAGAIESAHIAQILDSGKDPETDLPFIVMELLKGEDLEQLLKRVGPLAPDLALRILAQACLGLQKAHAARVMHRDIKPANLFLTQGDEGVVTVKLLDFGVAKMVDAEVDAEETADVALTRTRSLLGSPLYMSPEQARGHKDIDYRTDLWSIGVVFYRMLTGRAPHEQIDALGELIIEICSTPAAPVQDTAPWVPPEIAAFVQHALRISRSERMQSASAMLQAIRPLLPGGFTIREEMLIPLPADIRAQTAPRHAYDQAASAVTMEQGPMRGWTSAAPPSIDTLSLQQQTPATTGSGVASSAPSEAPAARTTVSGEAAAPPTRKRTLALGAGALALVGAAAAWATLRSATAVVTPVVSSASAPASASAAPPPPRIDPERLASFAPLPTVVTSPANPLNDDKIALGRMLFYDARLSKNHDISCNSCHPLDRYGADGEKVSAGHAHKMGTRNSPSVYNAAGHFALLWDGSAANLEEQGKRPFSHAGEMGTSDQRIEATLRSICEYAAAFGKAFPGEPAPVSTANAARAVAAFERKLTTRGRWDKFLEGEQDAITDAEKAGFNAFVEVGCVTCHFGPNVGATMFQKLGLVRAWPQTKDRGRFEVTQQDVDYMVFKVPSLRNIANTAPYFHDGSISSLDEAVRLMAKHQLGKDISDKTADSIVTWLKCLTGDLPREYVAMPALPPSAPGTPKPDPR